MVDPNTKSPSGKTYAECVAEHTEYVKQAISAIESHQDKESKGSKSIC